MRKNATMPNKSKLKRQDFHRRKPKEGRVGGRGNRTR